MIVAGVGFRRGVVAKEIVQTVERALAQAALGCNELSFLATAASRAAEPGLVAAARILGVEVEPVPADSLAKAGSRVVTRSERVLALHGVGSVAESAALSAAGPRSRLVVQRISSGRVTCAIATGAGP